MTPRAAHPDVRYEKSKDRMVIISHHPVFARSERETTVLSEPSGQKSAMGSKTIWGIPFTGSSGSMTFTSAVFASSVSLMNSTG